MKLNKQTAVDIDPKTLRAHPNNPRRADVPNLTKLVKSNGITRRVVVWAKDRKTVLAGWHRTQAAVAAQLPTVPCILVDCDSRTALRIVLADNRASDRGGYDERILAEILSSVSASGLLESSGYLPEDLEAIIDRAKGAGDETEQLKPVYQVAAEFGDADTAAHWKQKMEATGHHCDLKLV